jgi:galactose mutarotase-like enzyme
VARAKGLGDRDAGLIAWSKACGYYVLELVRRSMDRGRDRIVLENGPIRVVLLPGSGGRIESLQGAGFEFLLQPTGSAQRNPCEQMTPGISFQEGACSGIDECLPTVARSGIGIPDLEVPDHGDFWAIPWTIQKAVTAHSVTIAADGMSRPLRFTKRLKVSPTSLRIDYVVQNLGSKPVEYLYACHPLFAIDAGDRIVVPTSVESLRIESSAHNRLGNHGDSICWPIGHDASGPIDLSITLPSTADSADMLYAGPLTSGHCGLFRSAVGRGVVLHFDQTQLPYLGLWLCYGGWPDDSERRQFAVALEPTVAARGSLESAIRDNVSPVLEPSQTRSWTIEFLIAGLTEVISEETFVRGIEGGVLLAS